MNEPEVAPSVSSVGPSDPTARWTPADLDARLEDFARTVGNGTPGATVVPPDRTRTTAGDRALDVLRELADRPPEARIELKATVLGRGGMSEVRLGVQVALDREVAIKRLPDDHFLPIARELVREARIVGRLEHPNVVPVHDLVIDANGAPMLVLERIEGQPWSTYLADAGKLRADHGVEDALGWHLHVLVQVASALHHAHQRSIVHRDVKPDNVMIGALGQVYLVDWGIAVDLRPEALDAYDPSVLAGTPVYLAPEMVLGDRVARAHRRVSAGRHALRAARGGSAARRADAARDREPRGDQRARRASVQCALRSRRDLPTLLEPRSGGAPRERGRGATRRASIPRTP